MVACNWQSSHPGHWGHVGIEPVGSGVLSLPLYLSNKLVNFETLSEVIGFLWYNLASSAIYKLPRGFPITHIAVSPPPMSDDGVMLCVL